jgi:hypothetical protein
MACTVNFGVDKFLGVFKSWKSFNDFEDIFKTMPKPELARDWMSDEVFGKL